MTVSMPKHLDDLAKFKAAGVGRVLVPVTSMAGIPAMVKKPEDALKWRSTIEDFREL